MIEMTAKEKKLVQDLIEKTKSGAVIWEETADSQQFFTTFRGEFSVVVRCEQEYGQDSIDPEHDQTLEATTYSLVVQDAKKRKIVNLEERITLYEEQSSQLEPLYDAARASARKYVDEGLDSILDELKNSQ